MTDLIAAATSLIDSGIVREPTRARACALLLRQSLETTLRRFWSARAMTMLDTNTRAQLLCLREYTSDKDAARLALRTWTALSNACHAKTGYGLPPSRATLRGWAADVARLQQVLDG